LRIRSSSLAWLVGLTLVACRHRTPAPQTPFVWEARAVQGEVRVLEALGAHPAPEVHLGSYLGEPLPEARVAVRSERAQQLASLPTAVGWELPGAMNGLLGPSWAGTFHSSRWPSGRRERLREALARGHGLDDELGELARAVGGDATLVTWVDRLQAEPLSLRGFPGDLVRAAGSPVVIDHVDEPYEVELRVGVALVAADGAVVLRYHQDMSTVLSGARPPEVVGRALARDLAGEVYKVWHQPPAAARSARAGAASVDVSTLHAR